MIRKVVLALLVCGAIATPSVGFHPCFLLLEDTSDFFKLKQEDLNTPLQARYDISPGEVIPNLSSKGCICKDAMTYLKAVPATGENAIEIVSFPAFLSI